MSRVEKHIEVSNEKLLKSDSSNLKAVMMLYHSYASYMQGTPQFFDKLEKMLEKDVVRKSYTLPVGELIQQI